jgi:chitinase
VDLSDPGPAGVVFAASEGIGTILATNSPPDDSISSPMLVASRSGLTEATFVVTLSAPATAPVSVDFATADGTALGSGGSPDYVATAGTLAFLPGQTEETITVIVNPAIRYDQSKTFNVNLSAPVGLSVSAGQGTATIENPNPPPHVSIANATVAAIVSVPTDAVFTVTLSVPSNQPVTISYATSDGNARGGFDYVAIPSAQPARLTFASGQTEQTLTVTVAPEPGLGLQKFFHVHRHSELDLTARLTHALGPWPFPLPRASPLRRALRGSRGRPEGPRCPNPP